MLPRLQGQRVRTQSECQKRLSVRPGRWTPTNWVLKDKDLEPSEEMIKKLGSCQHPTMFCDLQGAERLVFHHGVPCGCVLVCIIDSFFLINHPPLRALLICICSFPLIKFHHQ